MALILQHSDSAYYPCFQNLFKNVVTSEKRILFHLSLKGDYIFCLIILLKMTFRFGWGEWHHSAFESNEKVRPSFGGDRVLGVQAIDGVLDARRLPAVGQFALLLPVFQDYSTAAPNLQFDHSAGQTLLRSFLNLPERHWWGHATSATLHQHPKKFPRTLW